MLKQFEEAYNKRMQKERARSDRLVEQINASINRILEERKQWEYLKKIEEREAG